MKTLSEAPTLIVLAAGLGSRYGGLKQVAPVNPSGEAILDYSVYDAARAGFRRVVFVIRQQIEQTFKARLSSKFEDHLEVAYAYQELSDLPAGFTTPLGRTKPWGTLQATLVGAELFEGPFAVINADDFYGAESYRTLLRHLETDPSRCAMVGFRLRNTLSDFGPVSRGLCEVGADNLLSLVTERTRVVRKGNGAESLEDDGRKVCLSGVEITSMNMWGFNPAIVPQLRNAFEVFLQVHGSELAAECYLPVAVNDIVSRGQSQIEVLCTEDTWCGITYSEDYGQVVQTIGILTEEGKYPERLWP